jgi:hypothetical protein
MIVPTLAPGKLIGFGKVWKAGALVAVGAVGGGAALAVASIPDGSGVIHGCVLMSGTVPASGPNLRIIDSGAGEQCVTNAPTAGEPTERPLDWNATGPPGAPGSPGTPGAPGPAGKNITVPGGNTFTISGGQVITVGSGNGVTVAWPPVNARGPAIGQATLAGHPSLTFGVLSVSLAGANAPIGTGRTAGNVAVHEITISKKIDAASPKLSLACAHGTRYANATIALRAGGNKPILIYRLSGVQVTSYQTTGAGAVLLDRVSLSYTTIKITTQK